MLLGAFMSPIIDAEKTNQMLKELEYINYLLTASKEAYELSQRYELERIYLKNRSTTLLINGLNKLKEFEQKWKVM